MWLTASLAMSLFAAQPAADAYVEVRCPWMPIFFESGTTDLDAGDRQILDGPFLWYRSAEGGNNTRILLRTYTTGEPASDLGRLSEARADAVRTALIERHVPPDHIMISHTYGSEPRMVDDGWVGGWVYPEYYLTRPVRDRLFPQDGTVC